MGGGGRKGYNSDTGGITPMNIGGRLIYERERLFGMTEEERAWRAKFLKDQHLSPHEPVHVPEIYNELHNPIRRFYRIPGEALQNWLTPKVGIAGAELVRYGLAKVGMGVVLGYWAWYYLKYNSNNWEQHNGWKVYTNKRTYLPGDKQYPTPNLDHPGSFYVDRVRGFNDNVPDF